MCRRATGLATWSAIICSVVVIVTSMITIIFCCIKKRRNRGTMETSIGMNTMREYFLPYREGGRSLVEDDGDEEEGEEEEKEDSV